MKHNLLKLFLDSYTFKKNEVYFNANMYKSACCLLSQANFSNQEFRILITELLYNRELLIDFEVFQSIGILIKNDDKKQTILIDLFEKFIIELKQNLKPDEILTDTRCAYVIDYIISRHNRISNKNFTKLYNLSILFLLHSNIDCYNKLMLYFLKQNLTKKQIKMINNNLLNDFIEIHKSNYSSTYLSKDVLHHINFTNFNKKSTQTFMIDTLFTYGLQMSKFNDIYKYSIWAKILENISKNKQILKLLQELAKDDSHYSKEECIKSMEKNKNIRIHHWLFLEDQIKMNSPLTYIHSSLLNMIKEYLSKNDAKLLLIEFNHAS